jgi:DNA modification methylase
MALTVVHGDCLRFIREAKPEEYSTVFLDPPDNLGLKYDGYTDYRADYYDWLGDLIWESMQKADLVWVSFYHKHLVKLLAKVSGFIERRPFDHRIICWRFTFGQYTETDFASGWRPILRLSRRPMQLDSVRVPSSRAINGDSRAAGADRVPDDVWDFPRVVGNSAERRQWHPTQHPEYLYERIMRVSGRGHFLDLFGGTGTAIRVAKRLKRDATVVEQSRSYCANIVNETEGAELRVL